MDDSHECDSNDGHYYGNQQNLLQDMNHKDLRSHQCYRLVQRNTDFSYQRTGSIRETCEPLSNTCNNASKKLSSCIYTKVQTHKKAV